MRREIQMRFSGEVKSYNGKKCDCLDCAINQRFVGQFTFGFMLVTPGPTLEIQPLNHGQMFKTFAEAHKAMDAEAEILAPIVTKWVKEKFGQCNVEVLRRDHVTADDLPIQ